MLTMKQFLFLTLYALQKVSNQLRGEIPSGLSNIPLLLGLYFSNNEFSGPLPSELAKLAALQWLGVGKY